RATVPGGVSGLGADYVTDAGEQRRVEPAEGVSLEPKTQTRLSRPALADDGTGRAPLSRARRRPAEQCRIREGAKVSAWRGDLSPLGREGALDPSTSCSRQIKSGRLGLLRSPAGINPLATD
ncbi:hypothetical protein B1218_38450, partial [Pseudomonas ogarae]